MGKAMKFAPARSAGAPPAPDVRRGWRFCMLRDACTLGMSIERVRF